MYFRPEHSTYLGFLLLNVSQFNMPLFLVESIVHCPHGPTTLVQLNSNKTLVQGEVVANGILDGGGKELTCDSIECQKFLMMIIVFCIALKSHTHTHTR